MIQIKRISIDRTVLMISFVFFFTWCKAVASLRVCMLKSWGAIWVSSVPQMSTTLGAPSCVAHGDYYVHFCGLIVDGRSMWDPSHTVKNHPPMTKTCSPPAPWALNDTVGRIGDGQPFYKYNCKESLYSMCKVTLLESYYP